ncbi:phosphatidylinositol N-acetylglucosaminyltransferase subunit H-like isoform X2 [Rhynchophorus ferrugineus]|uniref:phosphatidylinositol N-acetylglucosaminyltransferase subunit H-like isoform X2 n=1 Tax=Rhynchophorus ferrugineus TaxID=354439 RepID=UPI003FCD31E7
MLDSHPNREQLFSNIYGEKIIVNIEKNCGYLKENITAIKGFGYQIKAKGRLKDSSIFIPYAIVQHIFLNEVIIKNRVIFLATFLTKNEKGEDKLVPLFTSTVPKLDCLKILYQELVTLHK